MSDESPMKRLKHPIGFKMDRADAMTCRANAAGYEDCGSTIFLDVTVTDGNGESGSVVLLWDRPDAETLLKCLQSVIGAMSARDN